MSIHLASVLAEILPPESLLPPQASTDWMRRTGADRAPVMVAPGTEEEAALVLSRASTEGWKVLPLGLGSWVEGGGPSDADIGLSTRRMKAVREYQPADLTFSAGAGLPLRDLQDLTRPHRQWLPLDPPGWTRGSLGALTSLGMAGPLRHLYGAPRDHVLGLTTVSGDGRVLRWGGRVVKNVAGFDLTRLTVGSWGALGLVTAVSARLFPLPEGEVTLAFPGPGVDALLPAARAMALSALPLAAVELHDPLEGPGDGVGGEGGRRSSVSLVLRLLGTTAQVSEMETRIRGELRGELGRPRRLEGDASIAFHEGLSRWEEGAWLVARLALLPSRMATLLASAGELRKLAASQAGGGEDEAGAAPAAVRLAAHVGAGVLRVAVGPLETGPRSPEPWVEALGKLRAALEADGGTLTLSSGPPSLMRALGPWGGDTAVEGLMKGLKAEVDPRGVMAPGRLGL